MSLRITILGCGTSGGVPRIGGDWGACDPAEPRNRRRRCSIVVENSTTRVLVDTSPDMRDQLLDAGIDRIDGVIWTHDHADQSHGLDDLRAFYIRTGHPVRGYADPDTARGLKNKFGYCFERLAGSMYPAIIDLKLFDGPFRVGGLDVVPIPQDHGNNTISQGFRFGSFAYSNDVVMLDDEALDALSGIKVWVVDAMRYKPHPTHAHLERTLGWIARVKPERAILTNMHIDLDYRKLLRELPAGVEPAYDGMVIEVPA